MAIKGHLRRAVRMLGRTARPIHKSPGASRRTSCPDFPDKKALAGAADCCGSRSGGEGEAVAQEGQGAVAGHLVRARPRRPESHHRTRRIPSNPAPIRCETRPRPRRTVWTPARRNAGSTLAWSASPSRRAVHTRRQTSIEARRCSEAAPSYLTPVLLPSPLGFHAGRQFCPTDGIRFFIHGRIFPAAQRVPTRAAAGSECRLHFRAMVEAL